MPTRHSLPPCLPWSDARDRKGRKGRGEVDGQQILPQAGSRGREGATPGRQSFFNRARGRIAVLPLLAGEKFRRKMLCQLS